MADAGFGVSKYARRIDANHGEIRDAFRRILGADGVVDCSRFGSGFPDILVGHGKICIPVEIKTKTGKLTDAQKKFPLFMVVVRNMDDVFKTVAMLIDFESYAKTKHSIDDYPDNGKDA